MRRLALSWLLLASSVAVPLAASADASSAAGAAIGPPLTPAAISAQREPRVMLVPGSTVYVANGERNYDLFRYGVYWYAFNEGDWYRARTHRGPFTAISVRYVPAAVVNVPSRYWRQPRGRLSGKVRQRDGYVTAKEELERGH